MCVCARVPMLGGQVGAGTESPLAPGCKDMSGIWPQWWVVAHSCPTCEVLPAPSLKRPGWRSCFFSFEFMLLIGSNYKSAQGGPKGRERSWERQRFTAGIHHAHLPPTPP